MGVDYLTTLLKGCYGKMLILSRTSCFPSVKKHEESIFKYVTYGSYTTPPASCTITTPPATSLSTKADMSITCHIRTHLRRTKSKEEPSNKKYHQRNQAIPIKPITSQKSKKVSYQGPPKPISKNRSSLPHAIPQRFNAQEPHIRMDLT